MSDIATKKGGGDLSASSCTVCGQKSSLRCSNCSQAVYCNREHQKEDWPKHKQICTPFKVQQDERLGRYLVASRDIRAEEVVLKEAPIIRGPAQLTEPVCLVCLQALEPEQCVPCNDCGWPMCSEKCRDNAQTSDHRLECRMTQEKDDGTHKVKILNFVCPHPLYQSILAMRCMMLREMEPERWRKLNLLESLCELRKDSEQWHSDRETVANFILRFYKPKAQWTQEQILRTVGIAQINGHELPITLPASVSVYAKASMVEHSCRANLSKSFTETGEIVLWSRYPIKKGTHLSICYTDALYGTENRKHHLKQTKLFECTCERCSDLSEFGTHFSSLKCSGVSKDRLTCSGLLLPGTAEDSRKSWQCNKCHVQVSYDEVNDILVRAGRDLSLLRDNVDNCERCVVFWYLWGYK